jgi:hypothetical protein
LSHKQSNRFDGRQLICSYDKTWPSDRRAWSLFGQVPKGWPLVKAICDYVHDRITFGYAHASPTKTQFLAVHLQAAKARGVGCLYRAPRRMP